MPFSRVAALAGLAVLSSTASAFPISNLPVSNDTFSQLSNTSLPQAERDALATAQVLPQLRVFFNQTTHAIEIETSDVAIQQSIPDSTIDDSCDHKVTSEGATAKGNVLNDTELSFGISNISWTDGVQVFADARLDSVLDINGDVKVELGKKVFGHCEHIAHKTVGLDVVSHGTVGLGLNFTASDAHVEKSVNGTGFDLVFDFECNTVGLVLSWNVQEVTANNCKLKILGIDILSYCGFIEKAVQKGVDTLSAKAIAVEAPKVAAKVEAALNTAIGGQVRIPLKL